MSIATLKKKTLAQYNNSSVGQPQFSLNGTRRSSGYIGQDTLGRSLVRSLSKNGELKGHGGCCGKYPTPEIKTSPEMACLNDSSIVKSSSLNTNGLLMSRNRWLRRPYPYSTTKSSSLLNLHNQSSYIDNLARKTIANSNSCNTIENRKNIRETVPKMSNCSITNYNAISKKVPHLMKPDNYTGAINSSEYLRSLDNKCTENDIFKFTKNTNGTPIGCGQ
jgi:hypothetical protein